MQAASAASPSRWLFLWGLGYPDGAMRSALLLAFLLALSCSNGPARRSAAPPPGAGAASIRATLLLSGLSNPVDLQFPPGDSTRLFIVEKTGRIRILKSGGLLPGPFLDLSARVSGGGEQGLLGLAFHPQYAANGRFYVDYTDGSGDTHIAEFLVSSDPDAAAATEHPLLLVDQPFSNHNAGQLAFGPDGYLYVGLGDGGSGGDPGDRAQNPDSLLGKMLRIDVNAPDPSAGTAYSIPPDNPFVGRAGTRPEIWAMGLRNPWRYSFDRLTGALYLADVGQNLWEEVDVEPPGAGGRNYGWNVMEGTHCYIAAPCDTTGLTPPVAEYGHDEGCSITGGYVYRGRAIPALDGVYFYGDYCSGIVRSFRFANGAATDERDWTASLRTASGGPMAGLSSFGQDARGELYLLRLSGELYRIDPGPLRPEAPPRRPAGPPRRASTRPA
jgi:glucose/arabinose dehydrogenase